MATKKMRYVSGKPTRKEKEMFITGIMFGAFFSFLGSFVVTSSFRIVDKGCTVQNSMVLIVSLIFFILILVNIPRIIKRL